MSDVKIECGQVWKLIDDKKYYNIGAAGDLMIVLSRDRAVWTVGTFWGTEWDNKPSFCGGARQRELGESELREIAVYVGHIMNIPAGTFDVTSEIAHRSVRRFVDELTKHVTGGDVFVTIVSKSWLSDMGSAMQLGVAIATGKPIWLLVQNDAVLPDALRKIASRIEHYNDEKDARQAMDKLLAV